MLERYDIRLLVWLIPLFSAACLTPIVDRSWVAVSSPHFEILSTMKAEEVVVLAEDLERFRALIHTVTRTPRVEPPVPTRITAFARRSELTPFRPSRRAAGFFDSGLRENSIVLADYSNELGASEIILHEYVHFVLRNGTDWHYPIWYDEGFAEFSSTARVQDGRLSLGLFPMARVNAFRYLKWMPMERVVSAQSYSDFREDEIFMFYAQAWALVHYLTLGRGDGASMSADLARYLENLELGLSPAAAFEDAFGMSTEVAGLRIIKALERKQLRAIGLPLTLLEYDRSAPSVRVPRRAEVSLRLGQLLLRKGPGSTEAAREYLQNALLADPDNARAHAGLGGSLKFEKRWDEAEPHFRRAVEVDPEDAWVQLDLAEFLHHRALAELAELAEESGAEARRALLGEARDVYRRSLEIDDSIPETWLMLGRTHLAAGEDASKGLDLIRHAYGMLPAQAFVIESLAEAYVAVDRMGEARSVLLRRAASLGGDSNTLDESIEERLQAIVDRRAKEADAINKESEKVPTKAGRSRDDLRSMIPIAILPSRSTPCCSKGDDALG